MELVLVGLANSTFQLSSGLVLLVASLIKGDGASLRWCEAGVGALLLLGNLVQLRKSGRGIATLLGMAAANKLSTASKSELEVLKLITALLSIGGAAKTRNAPQAVAEVAQTPTPPLASPQTKPTEPAVPS